MNSVYRLSAAVLVAAILAGCGAQASLPMASAVTAQQKSLMAAAATPVDPEVKKLITDFKSIQGFDATANAKRTALVTQLGDSDSDMAMDFLIDEYDRLASYPEAVRPEFEAKLGDALVALDTYDESLDEPAIAAGPGDTMMQATAYYDAMTRRRRHKGFFGWVGDGFKKFWAGLTGKKVRKKRRRRPSTKPSQDWNSDPYSNGGSSFGSDPYSSQFGTTTNSRRY